MSISEKIKLIMGRRGVTVTKLAEKMNISRQYLTKKFKNEDFTYIELEVIAELLQCDITVSFTDRASKERI